MNAFVISQCWKTYAKVFIVKISIIWNIILNMLGSVHFQWYDVFSVKHHLSVDNNVNKAKLLYHVIYWTCAYNLKSMMKCNLGYHPSYPKDDIVWYIKLYSINVRLITSPSRQSYYIFLYSPIGFFVNFGKLSNLALNTGILQIPCI